MIMLRNSQQVAAMLSLFRPHEAIVTVASDHIFWTANYKFMWLTQEIAALESFLVRSNREIIYAMGILSNFIEICEVLGSKLQRILLRETDCLECLVCRPNLTLIRLFNAIINESHSLMRATNGCETSNLCVSSEKRQGCPSIDSAERVSYQVNFWETLLLL